MEELSCHQIETSPEVNASIIWLHGLGANGYDLEPIVPELQLPDTSAIRFIFPHAPSIPVTINGGLVMPAWYDITDITIDREIDHIQIMKSTKCINKLIAKEVKRGVRSHRIIIAGFSQGGALAYQVALAYPKPLAGLVALSSYFATSQTIKPSPANKSLPIMVCHGDSDPIVPEILGRNAFNTLKMLGFNAEYHSYPMQHTICQQEVADLSRWIQSILSL